MPHACEPFGRAGSGGITHWGLSEPHVRPYGEVRPDMGSWLRITCDRFVPNPIDSTALFAARRSYMSPGRYRYPTGGGRPDHVARRRARRGRLGATTQGFSPGPRPPERLGVSASAVEKAFARTAARGMTGERCPTGLAATLVAGSRSALARCVGVRVQ